MLHDLFEMLCVAGDNIPVNSISLICCENDWIFSDRSGSSVALSIFCDGCHCFSQHLFIVFSHS